MTRAVWGEGEEAGGATELEVEDMTEASAATAGEEGSPRAGMAAVVAATRETIRDSLSTGARGEDTATPALPGEETWEEDQALGWEARAMVATPTIPDLVGEDTGQEGAPGDRGEGADTRTEGINDEDDGEDDDIDNTLIENLSSVLF